MSLFNSTEYKSAFRSAINHGCTPAHARQIAIWVITDGPVLF